MRLFKEVTYKNFYTKKTEKIKFMWNIDDGFASEHEAYEAVRKIEQDPKAFALVFFKGMYYPVSMQTLDIQIVITSGRVYYKYKEQGLKIFSLRKYAYLPFYIDNARISTEWNSRLIKDMIDFDPYFNVVGPAKATNKGYVAHNAMVLLAIFTFDTQIAPHNLNCVDGYFDNPPSRQKLWAQGIKTINPFTQKIVMLADSKDGKTYSFKEYKDSYFSEFQKRKKA